MDGSNVDRVDQTSISRTNPHITRQAFAPPGTLLAFNGASGSSAPLRSSAPALSGQDVASSDASCPRVAANIPTWKRGIDVAFCLLALPMVGIAAMIIAVIRLASPGPILFRQERVGLGGRRFKLYKFRTMHVSAEVASHQTHFAELVRSNTPMQKMDARGDSRLIPGGRWLRAAGIDELPQIINVLRGEMSLVGPRPCIPYEYEQYSAEQRGRCACVPGLTGLWQVSGKNRTTFEQMVQLDIAYARQLSPWLDLKIIIMTVPAVGRQIAEVRTAQTSPAVGR